MLKIYPIIIAFVRSLRPSIQGIERRDADLARQLRRAAASVALNVGEGQGNSGGTRTARYSSALGSMRETMACLDVAEAFGYLPGVDAVLAAQANQITGTLVKLAQRRG